MKIQQIDKQSEEQITQCLNLLEDILGKDLLGVYLYGSSIYIGEGKEYWEDIENLIQSCAEFIVSKINEQIVFLKLSNLSNYSNRSIRYADQQNCR